METLTTCPICYSKYSKPSKIPLILSCGHTFCQACTSKFSKCPLCRQCFTSSTINLLIFQLSSTPGQICEHRPKKLFCPTCVVPLCISCILSHNMHGIVPITDPGLLSQVDDQLNETFSELELNKINLLRQLEKVTKIKEVSSLSHGNILKSVEDEFEILLNGICARKREILEELDGYFTPIFSKIDTLLVEIEQALKKTNLELSYEEKSKSSSINQKLKYIKSFKPKYINEKMIEKVASRASTLPTFSIDSTKLLNNLQVLGRFRVPSSGFFSFLI